MLGVREAGPREQTWPEPPPVGRGGAGMEPLSGPHRPRYMRPAVVGTLATSLLLGGCAGAAAPGQAGAGEPSSVAPALDATWRDTLTITPATAAPGQRLALRFASKEVRGIAFSLSRWGTEGWTIAYYLTSDWGSPGSHSPTWWSVEDGEGRGWVDVGVGGPGPDHVIVPDVAPAGEYLLCTANSIDEACAILTVTG